MPPTSSGVDPPLSSDLVRRIRAMAMRFRGDVEQVPPAFSAKKIAGKPAYELAREGKPVELKVENGSCFKLHNYRHEGANGHIYFVHKRRRVRPLRCSRSWQDLECGAHLTSLRRTKSGAFSVEEAHTLDELRGLAENVPALEALCVHPRTLLPEMPPVRR